MASLITKTILDKLKDVEKIRNVCIVAHVDHGKTTLADNLVASNGVISTRSAGKLRYMDNTDYEQQHQITIKSSSIALLYDKNLYKKDADPDKYVINVLDSPGHMDFGHEVSSALRVTDGCIVVVDAVEGVCIQTRKVLRQAWVEKVKPILLINKIDKLILTFQMTPFEAYERILRVIEQANETIANLWAEQYMTIKDSDSDDDKHEKKEKTHYEGEVTEQTILDDEDVYFSPEKGNIAFSSAIHGWAFTIDKFCDMYEEKLKINKKILKKTLWGNYYFSPKTKKIYGKPPTSKSMPMFVQFILRNIWEVYNAVTPDRDLEKLEKINKAMKLNVSERDMKHEDSSHVITSFMSKWLPLAQTLLGVVVDEIPSPQEAQKIRIPALWRPQYQENTTKEIKTIQKSLENDLYECSRSENSCVIAYISKVFSIPNEELMRKSRDNSNLERGGKSLIAMARLFSGKLRIGQKVHLLGARYDPSVSTEKHRVELEVPQLYLLMGPSLEPIDEVEAGSVFGIGGDEFVNHIVKTGTISSEIYCPGFDGLKLNNKPIVRVAVEPVNSNELSQFEKGLKLLFLGDPAIDLEIQENGEYVIGTLGELHLSRCLQLLKEDYAKVDIKASAPIVSFRESILHNLSYDAKTDKHIERTKDGIVEIEITAKPLPSNIAQFIEKNAERVKIYIQKFHGSVLKQEFIDEFNNDLKKVFKDAGKEWEGLENYIWSFGPKRIGPNILFNQIKGFSDSIFWKSIIDDERRYEIKCVKDENGLAKIIRNEKIEDEDEEKLILYYIYQQLDNIIKQGFQFTTKYGPLCEEPMYSVAFFITGLSIISRNENNDESDNEEESEEVSDDSDEDDEYKYKKKEEILKLSESKIYSEDVFKVLDKLGINMITTCKKGFRKAFELRTQRLYEAYYLVQIQVNLEMMGKVYSVLRKRRAQIIEDEINESSGLTVIHTYLPASESFGFAEELYSKTAGSASAQLSFSHWDLLDIDPNFIPSTEEELEEHGENIGGISPNLARLYVDAVRQRKGLKVKKKLVESANKQRTLSKKK